MEEQTVKDRLVKFLDRKGVSQGEFGMRVGVSRSYVANIRVSIQPKTLEKIAKAFPDLNTAWLLTGEGDMLSNQAPASKSVPSVPLYSLDVVAGFASNEETTQYVERLLPWPDAKDGDFAVHVSGDSMQPAIPDGALVLLRPAPFGDMLDIEFGKVHAVCIGDDRTLLKQIKPDHNNPANFILASFNPDYPPISIPIKSVSKLFLAKSVKYDI